MYLKLLTGKANLPEVIFEFTANNKKYWVPLNKTGNNFWLSKNRIIFPVDLIYNNAAYQKENIKTSL